MCHAKPERFKVMGKRLNRPQGFRPKKKVGVTVSVCKCRDCGLIFSNPIPIPENLSDHYGVPPESYWTEEYFKIDPRYWVPELEEVNKLKPIVPGMKSLDIGAGIGKQMIALEKAGFDAYGVEPSEPFYRMAIERMNISPDKLTLAAAETAEFPENTFDFISFGVVLEHLFYPSEAVARAMKWLKPGGIMHIEVPSSDWMIVKWFNFLYKVRGMDYVGNISPMHTPFHLTEFSNKSFVKNGEINNYKVVRTEYYPCETYMPKVFDKMLRKYMKWTDKGMVICVYLQKPEA